MPDDDALLPPPPSGPPPRVRRPGGRKPHRAGLAPAEQAAVRLQQALLAGFVVYLQNPGMSLAAVWETAAISGADDAPRIRDCIGLDTFHDSAAAQSWVKRRDTHWREVRARVEHKLLDQHVQRTLSDIEHIQTLRLVAMQHIRGDAAANIKPIQPKSLEGVMKAYTDLTRLEAEMRVTVVEQAADAARADGASSADPLVPGQVAAALVLEDDGFSDVDIENMARAAALGATLDAVVTRPPLALIPAAAPPAAATGDNDTLQRAVIEDP